MWAPLIDVRLLAKVLSRGVGAQRSTYVVLGRSCWRMMLAASESLLSTTASLPTHQHTLAHPFRLVARLPTQLMAP